MEKKRQDKKGDLNAKMLLANPANVSPGGDGWWLTEHSEREREERVKRGGREAREMREMAGHR